MKKSQKIYLPIKRLIAILGSFVGIIVCIVIVWWWVLFINLFSTKGHPFFFQKRVGKNGKYFTCLKFRTMSIDTKDNMSSFENRNEKMTKFGKFIRLTSIDETLQLFNIFIGQMAFVGPRPIIDTNENDLLTVNLRKQNGSIVLRPGLTGYAQIHTRELLPPDKKAQYDYFYLKNFSLWMDIKIFVFTVFRIFGPIKGK